MPKDSPLSSIASGEGGSIIRLPAHLSAYGGFGTSIPAYTDCINRVKAHRGRTANTTGQLFILLFSFQFSFFLLSKLGLFLLFSFAFIFFPLITHVSFSLLENELYFLTRL